jgi:hypothetical protein
MIQPIHSRRKVFSSAYRHILARAFEAPQRWQMETVNSMIKRNVGSALRGKTAGSHERDMRLKVLTLNAMIPEALSDRIETGQEESSFQKKPK